MSAGNQIPMLFYWLEREQNIRIHIYNLVGTLLCVKRITRGKEGGKGNHMNHVLLAPEFNLYTITPGVYYYLIFGEETSTFLYKGKIGVQP